MAAISAVAPAAVSRATFTARRPTAMSVRKPVRVMAIARQQPPSALEAASKALAIAAAAAMLLTGSPAGAASTAGGVGPESNGLNTETAKKGLKALIEYSDISNQSNEDVVDKLKNKILPEAMAALDKAAAKSGSSYPDSIAQELNVVKTEIDALEKQAREGQSQSVLKSAASGIEQQINALKGIMGYD